MAKIERNNLGYLGIDYQLKLLNQLLTDNQFASSIIDIVDPNYFDDPTLRIIASVIIDAKEKNDIIPDMSNLKIRLLDEIIDDVQRRYVLTQLSKIEEQKVVDVLMIQEKAMNFCKQQEFKKAMKQIQKIIDKNENLEEIETIWRKALEHGDNKDNGCDIFHNLKDALAEDFRDPIRTGIDGLDEVMNGGLSKRELAVIIAPLGSGKTSLLTKIGNTAALDGKKVLQIFFEDKEEAIKRKHMTCWSGVDLTNLSNHEPEVMRISNEMELKIKGAGGGIFIKKMAAYGTTMPIIKAYIRKKINEGFKPDLLLLDYIDCVQPSKHFDDTYAGEGAVMRELETILDEYDMAGWTATQGNRESVNAELITVAQMGGSIKKAQYGHFVMSVARNVDHKEDGTATIYINKSRFGKDGITFKDVLYDLGKIKIEINRENKGMQPSVYKKTLASEQQSRVNDVLNATRERGLALNGQLPPNPQVNAQ